MVDGTRWSGDGMEKVNKRKSRWTMEWEENTREVDYLKLANALFIPLGLKFPSEI